MNGMAGQLARPRPGATEAPCEHLRWNPEEVARLVAAVLGYKGYCRVILAGWPEARAALEACMQTLVVRLLAADRFPYLHQRQ
jgi:hypothetical protein